MINITNKEESKKIDEILINKYHIPEDILIENAAMSILNNIDLTKNKYIIVCGPGNNGADGLCLARHLFYLDKEVKIICAENKNINYKICKSLGIEFINEVEKCDVLIDAIFGFGFDKTKGLNSYYSNLINQINDKKDYMIVSIDQISADIKSDLVLMLTSYKESMLNSGVDYKVLEINFKNSLYINVSNKYLVDEKYIEKIKINRNPFYNKTNFGKLAIYSGYGAALMAVKASIKCGSGYTYLLSDVNTINANLIKNPECINYNIDSIKDFDNIVIGPNLFSVMNEKEIKRLIKRNLGKKMVLDADAITVLSKNKKLLNKLDENVILTPHIGEFSRISDFKESTLINDPFSCLKAFKNDFRGCILLKGKNTIIYDGNEFYVINIANSKMASAGMGDVLSGMIGSYIAQGYSIKDAAIYAAYKHAKLGYEITINKDNTYPSELLNNL